MEIVRLAEEILARAQGYDRFLIGIAGPPGSGKSTSAEALARKAPQSAVLPLDGFHYDNAILDQLGLRSRKGAPETFDFAGFAAALGRIRAQHPDVAIPLFDRGMDLARAGAGLIGRDVRFVIAEGNYLLLDEEPWSALASAFDLTVYLDVPAKELERRLLQRWSDAGYSKERARQWVTSNDLPNAKRVMSRRRPADIVISDLTC